MGEKKRPPTYTTRAEPVELDADIAVSRAIGDRPEVAGPPPTTIRTATFLSTLMLYGRSPLWSQP